MSILCLWTSTWILIGAKHEMSITTAWTVTTICSSYLVALEPHTVHPYSRQKSFGSVTKFPEFPTKPEFSIILNKCRNFVHKYFIIIFAAKGYVGDQPADQPLYYYENGYFYRYEEPQLYFYENGYFYPYEDELPLYTYENGQFYPYESKVDKFIKKLKRKGKKGK